MSIPACRVLTPLLIVGVSVRECVGVSVRECVGVSVRECVGVSVRECVGVSEIIIIHTSTTLSMPWRPAPLGLLAPSCAWRQRGSADEPALLVLVARGMTRVRLPTAQPTTQQFYFVGVSVRECVGVSVRECVSVSASPSTLQEGSCWCLPVVDSMCRSWCTVQVTPTLSLDIDARNQLTVRS